MCHVCMHVCVYGCVVYTWADVCVCLWLFIWRSEISVGHLTLIVSTLLFEAESLIEPRAPCWCIMASQVAHDPLVSTLYAGITRRWSCSWPFAWVVGMRTKVLVFTLKELYSPKHLSCNPGWEKWKKANTDREMFYVQGLQELILFKSPYKAVLSSSTAKLYG